MLRSSTSPAITYLGLLVDERSLQPLQALEHAFYTVTFFPCTPLSGAYIYDIKLRNTFRGERGFFLEREFSSMESFCIFVGELWESLVFSHLGNCGAVTKGLGMLNFGISRFWHISLGKFVVCGEKHFFG